MRGYIQSCAHLTESKKVEIDYESSRPDDLVEIIGPQLHSSTHNNKVYTFGYKFADSASLEDRAALIRAIQQFDNDTAISDVDLTRFILRPIKCLDNYISTYHIDCLVYPLSGRSPLVTKIVRAVNDVMSRKTSKVSFDLVKAENGNELGCRNMNKIASLKCSSILVIDDINTTGSTINEILRKLSEINTDCNIFVFTLIGK